MLDELFRVGATAILPLFSVHFNTQKTYMKVI